MLLHLKSLAYAVKPQRDSCDSRRYLSREASPVHTGIVTRGRLETDAVADVQVK